VRTTHDLIQNGELAAGVRWTNLSTSSSSGNGDGNHSTWIWNASGQYDFSQALFVRGTLGTNFRLPTAEELFANDPEDERGNLALKPESSRGVNLSLGGAAGNFNWELTGFARDVTNLISCDGINPDDDTQCLFINESKVKVRGGEFTVNAKLAPGLTGQASYTVSSSKSDDTDKQIARVPKQSAKASLDWTPEGAAWGGVVSINWTGASYTPISGSVSRPLLLTNGAVTTTPFTYNYGNFTLVNLGAHYRFSNSFRLNVALENAFNKHYGRASTATLDTPVTVGGVTAKTFVVLPYGNPQTLRVSLNKSF
jgi:vitamin B12 transporter